MEEQLATIHRDGGWAIVPGTPRHCQCILDWLTFHRTSNLGSFLVEIHDRDTEGKWYKIIFQYALEDDYKDLVNYINQTI